MSETTGTSVRNSVTNFTELECLELNLVGRVDDDSATILCRGIYRAIANKQPFIMFYIHSPGGLVAAGKRIIDAMNVYRSVVDGGYIHTHVAVEAKSMAAVIFLCGNVRTMCTSAILMIHQVSMIDAIPCKKTATGSAATSNYHTHLNLELFHLIADRCTLSMEVLQSKAFAQDWYVYSAEAKNLNMVQKVTERSPFVFIEAQCKVDMCDDLME
eukprot:gene140-233_t